MKNLQKLIALLERVQPPRGVSDREHIELIRIVQKNLRLKTAQLNELAIFRANNFPTISESQCSTWISCCYMLHVVHSIIEEFDPYASNMTDTIRVFHAKLTHWLRYITCLHISSHLSSDLACNPHNCSRRPSDIKANGGCFVSTPSSRYDERTRFEYLGAMVRALNAFYTPALQWLHKGSAMDYVSCQYVCGIFELLAHPATADDAALSAAYNGQLDQLCSLNINQYMLLLFVCKSIPSLRPVHRDRIHSQLMQRVQLPNGYAALLHNVLPDELRNGTTADGDRAAAIRHRSDVVSNICARRGHTAAFLDNIRQQCEDLLGRLLADGDASAQNHFVTIAIDTLNRIWSNPSKDADAGAVEQAKRRAAIVEIYVRDLRRLVQPGDLLTGAIVLEHRHLVRGLTLMRDAFDKQLNYKLPARLLAPWLPVLLELHSAMDFRMQVFTCGLIVRCLWNASDAELAASVDALLEHRLLAGWYRIHDRVVVRQLPQKGAFVGVVRATSEPPATFNASATLVEVLKTSEHNVLIYRVFLHLLSRLADVEEDGAGDGADGPLDGMKKTGEAIEELDSDDEPDEATADSVGARSEPLVADLEELEEVMSALFRKRLAIVSTLSDLAEYKPFHSQFNENPAASMECMSTLLRKRVSRLRERRDRGLPEETLDTTNLVILSVIREFLTGLNYRDRYPEFSAVLREYRAVSQQSCVRQSIDDILRLLSDDVRTEQSMCVTPVEAARILCSAQQPHLKVYGMMQIRQMVDAGRDEDMWAKRHTILMLAMDALKHEDSYVFLNAVKLLVSLNKVMEDEVIETLVAEFRLPNVAVDYRLKVCEAIVKVVSMLGPMSYNFKDLLLPCFVSGCTHADADVRTASMSALATLLRHLSYEVSTFFNELVDIVQHVIAHDTHVPCRRACVMMLAHLIHGFEQLSDFGTVLLPVYRSLKYVVQNETDRTTIIHAQMGLDCLRQKVTAFMTVDPQPPEIRILGVKKDQTADKRDRSKRGIFEIL